MSEAALAGNREVVEELLSEQPDLAMVRSSARHGQLPGTRSRGWTGTLKSCTSENVHLCVIDILPIS